MRRLLWLLLDVSSAGYLPGDFVPLLRRVQHNEQRTSWHEVPQRVTPRFMKDHSAVLDLIPADHPDREPYKISLALSGLELTTPWITVADGRGQYLTALELQLTASGDSVMALRTETEYAWPEEPPKHIVVRTVWEHAMEHDLTAALAWLFVLAACGVCALTYLTCRRHGAFATALLFGDAYDDEDHERERLVAASQRRRQGYSDDRPFVHDSPSSRFAYSDRAVRHERGGTRRRAHGHVD